MKNIGINAYVSIVDDEGNGFLRCFTYLPLFVLFILSRFHHFFFLAFISFPFRKLILFYFFYFLCSFRFSTTTLFFSFYFSRYCSSLTIFVSSQFRPISSRYFKKNLSLHFYLLVILFTFTPSRFHDARFSSLFCFHFHCLLRYFI